MAEMSIAMVNVDEEAVPDNVLGLKDAVTPVGRVPERLKVIVPEKPPVRVSATLYVPWEPASTDSEAGLKASVKLGVGAIWLTVRPVVAECLSFPLTPLTVIV